MNKRKLIRSHLLVFVIGIIVGSIGIVIAESINSNEVLYDNSNSNTSSDNVQDVLDEMYNIIEHNSTGFSLLMHSPTGLSTELIGGLYRYQGVQDAGHTVDNYICFGTTNKSDCVNDTDKYMYRIIGINTSGQMKLIKKEALNTKYQWNSSSGVEWNHSDLYNGLNGNYYLTNTDYVPSNWISKIVESDWHYLLTTDSSVSTITQRELEAPVVSAKIGLMYLHDYANALETKSYSKTSWIHLSNNDTSDQNTSFEMSLVCYNGSSLWVISSGGGLTTLNPTSTSLVRPVFFLRASERIASGSGTIADPYVLGESL